MTLRITWLLDEVTISATTRLALAQADALANLGYDVRIAAAREPLGWRATRAEWLDLDELTAASVSADAAVVATSATTIAIGARIAAGRVVHLAHDASVASDSGSRSGVARLVVDRGVALGPRADGEDAVFVPPIVDEEFHRERRSTERPPMRLLVCGASQTGSKGIGDAYGAVAHARWFHQKVELVRVSPWLPSRDEPLDQVDEFHVALSPAEMARLTHSCDVALIAARAEEGFSLPVVEALASGIPTLLTSTPSHLALAVDDASAFFAPERSPVELGERLIELLSDDLARGRLREGAIAASAEWRSDRVGPLLARYFSSR